jgi:drug/metabolite transporter (DMT)-like permease
MKGKIQLDRIFWRKSLTWIFIGLILYACTMIALYYADYHHASSQLKNLNDEIAKQASQGKIAVVHVWESRQKLAFGNIVIQTIAIFVGLIGLFFVERKTRK